ncbi:MAG TPA: site-specific integrase [Pyrinomonadaceae bacterium]|nr:site-specific integrase [Pyrinomonadaceae bacterium]
MVECGLRLNLINFTETKTNRDRAVPMEPIDLRHTFGTRLADAGVDVVKIKELMGHASIVTTMRYIRAPIKGSEVRSSSCQSIDKNDVTSLSPNEKRQAFRPAVSYC